MTDINDNSAPSQNPTRVTVKFHGLEGNDIVRDYAPKKELTKLCRQCSNEIPDAARLCTKCHSYQDMRGWIPISSTVLAMLVALVTVSTSLINAIGNNSISKESSSLVNNPVVHKKSLSFIATNSGKSPAMIEHIFLENKIFPGHIDLIPREPSDTFIPFGSKQVTYDAKILASVEESRATMSAVLNATPDDKKRYSQSDLGEAATQLVIVIKESDGSDHVEKLIFHPVDFAILLGEHTDQCLKEQGLPSFERECLSEEERKSRFKIKRLD